MRTLSASATTAIAADPLTIKADVLIEAADIGLYWSIGFEGPPASGSWSHRYLSLGTVRHEVPRGGGLSRVSDLRISVMEDGTAGSLRTLANTAGRLVGAEVTCSILLDGEAYADKIVRFKGKIDEQTGWGNGVGTLVAVDDTLSRNIQLPKTTVDSDAYPNAPDQSIGAPIPILYGDGTDLILVPLILVDTTGRTYLASDHDNLTFLAQYALWPTGTQNPKAVLSPNGSTSVTARTLTLGATMTEQEFGLETASRSAYIVSGDVTAPENAIDDAPGIQALVETTSLNAAGEGFGQLGVTGVFTDPLGLNKLRITVTQHLRGGASAETVSGRFLIRTTDLSGNVKRQGLLTTEYYRHKSFIRDDVFEITDFRHEDEHYVQIVAEARNEGGAGGTFDYYIVGEVDIESFYAPTSGLEQLFLAAYNGAFEGRADDGSGTYTGTPDALIQNPVDVIYHILADILGLTVDTASVTSARSDRTNWTFAFGLGAGWFRERLNIRELLQDLAFQAGVYILPDLDGNGLKIRSAGDDTSSSLTITTDDTLLNGDFPSPSDTLAVRYAHADSVRHSYEVRYNWHPGRRDFDGLVYSNENGSNITVAGDTVTRNQNAHNWYGDKEKLVIDAWAIPNADTASRLLLHIQDYLWSEALSVRVEATPAVLALEPGDWVTLSDTELPTRDQTATFEVVATEDDLEAGTVGLLLEHVAVQSFEYLHILDQSGDDWYWVLDGLGNVFVQDSVPSVTGLTAEDATPVTVPYWVEIDDATPTTHYFFPDDLTGVPISSTSQPGVGTGMTDLALRGITGKEWTMSTDTIGTLIPVEA